MVVLVESVDLFDVDTAVPSFKAVFAFQEWCPREDSNLRPQDSYHFDFRRRFRVRGLDCPFTMGLLPLGAARPVSTHFPGFLRGLARDWHAERPAKRPPTLSSLIVSVSRYKPQLRNPVLYPTELRGHTDLQ